MVSPLCPNCKTAWRLQFDRLLDVDQQQPFSIRECPQCGLGVTDPVPDDLGAFYQQQYHGGRHGITARWCDRRRLRWLKSIRPLNAMQGEHHAMQGEHHAMQGEHDASSIATTPDRKPRLLDVGCGDGTFLRQASEAGWEVVGVERYPDLPRRLGLNVVETIEQAEPWGPFDGVTMWHSLEHMTDPDHTIAMISRLLSDHGKILIAVPNFGSLQAKLCGSHWLHLDVPRHLFHFSCDAIGKLASRHQLTMRRLRASEFEYDWMGWIQSGLNALRLRPNLLLKMMMGRSSEASITERGAHLLLGIVWGSLTWLPTAAGCWLGRGATLVVCLRPTAKTPLDDSSPAPSPSRPGKIYVP